MVSTGESGVVYPKPLYIQRPAYIRRSFILASTTKQNGIIWWNPLSKPSRKNCSATSTIHLALSVTRKTIAKPFFAPCAMRVLCGYISKEETPESYTQIHFLHIVIGYIDTELEILNRYGDTYPPKPLVCKRRWTGAVVELAELIYALHEMKRLDNGEIAMNELAGFFGELFGIRLDARSLYDAYTDIKRRKGESHTYFLDKLRERLTLRMQRDDEKEQERRR